MKGLVNAGIVQRSPVDDRSELTPGAMKESEASSGLWLDLPRTMEDLAGQTQSFISYAVNLKESKEGSLEPHRGKLRELAKRLSDLAGNDEDQKRQGS